MPRRSKRNIDFVPAHKEFKPKGRRKFILNTSELEAMRLSDVEGLSQIEVGESMNISRGTVQRLLSSGRKKLVQSILENAHISIETEAVEKEGSNMKAAFIDINGKIGGHIGHAKDVLVLDIETNEQKRYVPLVTGGRARAKWLQDLGVKAIVLNSIGQGAYDHLKDFGVTCYDGSKLTTEEAMKSYLAFELSEIEPDEKHHSPHHGHGAHHDHDHDHHHEGHGDGHGRHLRVKNQ